MTRRAVVGGAVMSCLTVAFLCGAAGWRALTLMAVFIVWQTIVTTRMQAAARRVEQELFYAERIARRVAARRDVAEREALREAGRDA